MGSNGDNVCDDDGKAGDDDDNITCYYKQGAQRASREPISLPATAPRDSS